MIHSHASTTPLENETTRRLARTTLATCMLAVTLVGVGSLIGARAATASGSQSSSLLSNPNLVSDPGFERGLAPWATAPGQNRAIYSSASSGSGQYYLETNSGSSSSPSLYQDAQTSVAAGHSYDASVLLRSPSGNPVSAALVVWATGGSATELGQTQFTVSSTSWTRYYTDVDVANAGHSDLRLQLYLGTSGQNLDVDGAMLQDAALGDAGFSQGLGTWKNATGQNRAIYSSSSSPDGRYYLETNSGSSSAPSLYQDVSTIPVVGHTYMASMFLRSPTGAPVSVNLDVWGLGGSSPDLGQNQVTVSSTTWTRYYTDVDVAAPGHTLLRLQLYLNTSGQNLDVSGTSLEDGGVADGCFDQSGLGPWQVSASAYASRTTGSGSPCGPSWLETNTNGGASSSIYQDIATNLVAGHPYAASVLMRSTTGGPISVSLVLWALGGSAPTEVGQTQITVGSSWAQYSTELDVSGAGHTDLRLQLYLNTSGQTLGVDGATLPDVSADPPLGPPVPARGVGVYGPSSYQSISQAVSEGWPVIGETGGLGTQGSPYTTALASAPDVAAAQAVAGAGRPITWMSFWTISAPSSGDTWYSDGYAAGRYVAAYLDSVSSSVKPSFAILDPEGYSNSQPSDFPSNFSDWASWVSGWSSGMSAVDAQLTPALYVNQSQYASYGLSALGVPVFVAISPILGNYPGNGIAFSAGANVDGYVAFYASCPAGQYETTMESWGGSYNTLQFPDSGDDCGP